MIRILVLLCALTPGAAAQAPAEPQPVLSGQTLDEKGQPVRRVALILLPLETNASGEPLAPYGVTSDTAGRFEFYGVPPGRYRLMAQRAGYLNTHYGARNTWATGTVFTLRGGELRSVVTVRMIGQSVISGRVIADEYASREVYVLQQRYQGGRRQWVRITTVNCDPNGEFRINKLAAGRYRLAAETLGTYQTAAGEPFMRPVLTYYPGTADEGSAEAIELRRGQTISGLILPVRNAPLFAVSGAAGESPSSSPSVQVSLIPSFLDVQYATTVATGKFRFIPVPPGSYLLVVFEMTGQRRLLGLQPVVVSDHDIDDLNLDLNLAARLRGTVKFAGDAPPGASLRIRLTPIDRSSFSGTQADVSADGTFVFAGDFLGAYQFEIQGLPAGAYVKSAVYGEKDALGGLDLARTGGDQKLEIVLGANAARISGVVRDEKGRALGGIVTLIPDPPQPQATSLYRRAEANETGRFLFQGLRPGKYRMYAWEEFEDGAQFDADVVAPFEARSLAVEVAEGERKEVEVTRIPAEEMEAASEPR